MQFFHLPDLGEGLSSADIVRWHIKAGDSIKKDENLVTVETAKSMIDIPCPISGVIDEIIVASGHTAQVGDTLVKFMSKENNATVVGNIPNEFPKIKFNRLTDEDLNLSPIRRHMCQQAIKSNNNAVTTTVTENINIDRWYEKDQFLSFFIHALCRALLSNPQLNAHYIPNKEYSTYSKKVDLGIAMQVEDGLFVPKIVDVQNQNINEIKQSIITLKDKTRTRTINPELLKNATFTLSNFGSLGLGLFATPMLNPPSVATIALGKIHDVLLLNNDKVKAYKHLPISLSFDHRVIYGAEAIAFIQTLIDQLNSATFD